MLLEGADRITKHLKEKMRFETNVPYEIVVVGSVAREEPNVKDIDFLIITPMLINDLLKTVWFDCPRIKIKKLSSCGTRKCFVHLTIDGKCKLKIDLFAAIKADKPFALLHHIGPKGYLMRIRRLAKDKGYLLNQYGIFDRKTSEPVPGQFRDVCDIQKFLNITCRPPAQRR